MCHLVLCHNVLTVRHEVRCVARFVGSDVWARFTRFAGKLVGMAKIGLTTFVVALFAVVVLRLGLRLLRQHFSTFGERAWAGAQVIVGGGVVVFGVYLLWSAIANAPIAGDSTPQFVAIAVVVVGFVLVFEGAWRRRRAPRRLARVSRGFHGLGGMATIAGAVLGLVLLDMGVVVVGSVLLAGSALVGGFLVYSELRGAMKTLEIVRRGMKDARSWPAPPLPKHLEEDGYVNPWADDRVQGTWQGLEARVAMTGTGALAEVALPRFPHSLTRAPNDEQAERTTGDAAFDATWSISELPEATWRMLLTHSPRTLLTEFAQCTAVSMTDGLLSFRLSEDRVDEVPYWLDRAVELNVAFGDEAVSDPESALLDRMPHEPCVAVRRSHYDWLFTRGHEAPLVVRAALADADATIRAWARAQRPPNDGTYR